MDTSHIPGSCLEITQEQSEFTQIEEQEYPFIGAWWVGTGMELLVWSVGRHCVTRFLSISQISVDIPDF